MTRTRINPTVAFLAMTDKTAQKAAQIEAIAALPDLSLNVYENLLNQLYAEPGFSDVEVEDIASSLGISIGVVAGAVGYLVEHGLIWPDDATVNRKKHKFLHAYAHGDEWKAEAYEAIKARRTNGRAKKARPVTENAEKTPKAVKTAKVAPVEMPRFRVKMANTADWFYTNAANAQEAREKAIRDGFKVVGRAYPVKG